MPAKKSLAACLLLLAAVTVAAEEQAAATDAAAAARKKILTRSLCFPGLGQLSEKKYAKAALFASTELFCLVQAFAANRRGEKNYGLYRSATSVEDVVRFRLLTEKYDRRRNNFLLAGAAVWILNMADAYFPVRKKSPKKNALSFHPLIDNEKRQTLLAVRFSF